MQRLRSVEQGLVVLFSSRIHFSYRFDRYIRINTFDPNQHIHQRRAQLLIVFENRVTIHSDNISARPTTFGRFVFARRFASGDLAGEVYLGKSLVISEETNGIWLDRREDFKTGESTFIDSTPFLCKPKPDDWEHYCKSVATTVKEKEIHLVVIDTYQKFSPAKDENSTAETMTAVNPIRAITEAGAAVLIVHHSSKSGGAEGTASRGSSALSGVVDIQIDFTRTNPNSVNDPHRTLKSISRFSETPREMVLELTDEGYITTGTKAEFNSKETNELIIQILKSSTQFLEWREIQSTLKEKGKPIGRAKLLDLLKRGYQGSLWNRKGEGAKGKPYQYGFDSSTVPALEDEPNIAKDIQICETCNIEMEPAEPVNGWRNFDCPNCRRVKPMQLNE
jgi:hypothetical protein